VKNAKEFRAKCGLSRHRLHPATQFLPLAINRHDGQQPAGRESVASGVLLAYMEIVVIIASGFGRRFPLPVKKERCIIYSTPIA
jgi:hypothetical protein